MELEGGSQGSSFSFLLQNISRIHVLELIGFFPMNGETRGVPGGTSGPCCLRVNGNGLKGEKATWPPCRKAIWEHGC